MRESLAGKARKRQKKAASDEKVLVRAPFPGLPPATGGLGEFHEMLLRACDLAELRIRQERLQGLSQEADYRDETIEEF